MKKTLLKLSQSLLSREEMKNIKGAYSSVGSVRLYINNNCGDGYQFTSCGACLSAAAGYPPSAQARCAPNSNMFGCNGSC